MKRHREAQSPYYCRLPINPEPFDHDAASASKLLFFTMPSHMIPPRRMAAVLKDANSGTRNALKEETQDMAPQWPETSEWLAAWSCPMDQ